MTAQEIEARVAPWPERLNRLRSLVPSGELVHPLGIICSIARLDGDADGIWLVHIKRGVHVSHSGHWEYMMEEGVGLKAMIVHFDLSSPPGLDLGFFKTAQKLEFTDDDWPGDKDEFHGQVTGIVDYIENTFWGLREGGWSGR